MKAAQPVPMASEIDRIAGDWVRLGVIMNLPPSRTTPDVERLLLDTARTGARNTRLLILGGTWLSRYGQCVGKHRLARLVGSELAADDRAVLGLLLEWSRDHADWPARGHFALALSLCEPALRAAPLADIERENATFAHFARERASALSRRWGRWVEPFEPKLDALRPEQWVMAKNPTLRDRVLVGGDLKASILAELDSADGAVDSEATLAQCVGATRSAVHEALRTLRTAGMVAVRGTTRGHVVERVRGERVIG